MSEPDDTGDVRTARSALWTTVASGAVFLGSGASLVTYILTGTPLPLVLCVVAVVGTLVVALVVWPTPAVRARWLRRVRVGVVAGLVSTFAYDASRYLLVEVAGFAASPFAAFPLFGQALLGDGAAQGGRLVAGIAFHLLNGTAFGIAYTVWFGRRPFWFGIGFALGLEACMLAIYPGWLDLRTLREFTQMSLLGHVVYGTTLGLLARRLLATEGTEDPP
jgi:hypothetical protein